MYNGIFKDGKKQGKGVWKKSIEVENTNIYEGEYVQDMKHGQGEFRWSTGGLYTGAYKDDLKCGYGEMSWADGCTYKGTWEYGIQNGLGLMSFADGLKKAGMFKDNVLVQLLTNKSMITDYIAYNPKAVLPKAFLDLLYKYV